MRGFESYIPNSSVGEKLHIRNIVSLREMTSKVILDERGRKTFNEDARRGLHVLQFGSTEKFVDAHKTSSREYYLDMKIKSTPGAGRNALWISERKSPNFGTVLA